jgi:hypothetical protein
VRTRTKAILLLVMLLAAAGMSLTFLLRHQRTRPSFRAAGWGTGKLKISETVYYTNTMQRIIRHWQQEMLRQASLAEDGRIEGPYSVYLTIDTTKPAVWIEDKRKVLADNYTELPKGMNWQVYRCAPEGNTELGSIVRLRMRGVRGQRLTPERFYIVGSGRGFGQIHVDFDVQARGSGYSSGPFRLGPYRGRKPDKNEDTYGSILVSGQEYPQSRLSTATSTAPAAPQHYTAGKLLVAANQKNWFKAEKLLYQMIEGYVLRQGLELQRLELNAGPDFTAAHAELQATDDSVIGAMFGRRRSADAYLKIDYMGEDTWYVGTASHIGEGSQPSSLDVEFALRMGPDMPASEYDKWIRKGREQQQQHAVVEASSKWNVTLPNGAQVEFIGVCENPSAGRQWWGPDGSPLESSPYYNVEPNPKRGATNVFEAAWMIEWPPGADGGAVTHDLQGALGSHPIHTVDRYGNDLHKVAAASYVLEKGQKETTLKLGAKVGNGDHQWVRFKNISLVKGESRGFQIELGNEP